MNLTNFKMNTLVSMVNELGGTATMKTFSQRSKAIDRINKLAEEKNIKLEDIFDDEGDNRLLNATAPVEPAPAEAPVVVITDDIEWDKVPVVITKEEAAAAEAPAVEAPTAGAVLAGEIIDALIEAEQPKKVKPPKAPSIRSVAEVLLLEVVSIDENKRKVGLSYDAILKKIGSQFPQAKTTVACLRWYAVHMREKGVMPPNRPRAAPIKPVAIEPVAEA